MNDRFLKAIWRKPTDATPIWIMRQAGRYLPEYQQIRKEAGSFMTLCKTPELACTVTLQPLLRFPLDAAILFSDILTIPDAMGLGLHFKEGVGPYFDHPIRTKKEIENIIIPHPEDKLNYVLKTIQLIKHELENKLPLIGFCGSPWTLAAYMVEGRSNQPFPLVQMMLSKEPQLLHSLLDKLANAVGLHLSAQANAGADVLMIFDTWGSLLKTEDYLNFSLAYIKKIIHFLSKKNKSIPIILFTKNSEAWLKQIGESGCHVLGVDQSVNLKKARLELNDKLALQGNLNPEILYKSPQEIREAVKRTLEEYGYGSGHIFNLGHGILPDVPVENVEVLVEAVHTFSQPYHQ